MAVSPARQAAFAILLRVEKESAYASELLHSHLLDHLTPADRHLATEITMGVLRWRSLLDLSFSSLIKIPLRKLDAEVLTALRMGAYQLAFLDRMPARAILHETVEQVKSARKRSATGMVNAVLRKLEHNRAGLKTSGQGMAANHAHPDWMVERWITSYGRERCEKICIFDQQVPPAAVRISDIGEEALRSAGIELAPGAFLKNARLVIRGDVTGTQVFRAGQVVMQDEGSQLIAALAGGGKSILDCCAAPGGKTGALALANPQARIVAVELHAHRARLLRERVSNDQVQVIVADACRLPFKAEFDRILADVPCSGTGTLARHPEIKWRLTPDDIRDLQTRQVAILNAALRHLMPGGRLIYSTCSLEPEENEQVVAKCLHDTSGFRVVPAESQLKRLQEQGLLIWDNVAELLDGDYLRTLPGVHPCDGFFAAVIQKD